MRTYCVSLSYLEGMRLAVGTEQGLEQNKESDCEIMYACVMLYSSTLSLCRCVTVEVDRKSDS